MNPYPLHNKILANLAKHPLNFAQIYDAVKPGSGRESVRQVAHVIFELACENLIWCDEVFAEPGNGATRERQMIYSITERGKTYLKGLSTTNILDSKSIDDQLALTAEKTSGHAPVGLAVKGGGATAPALSSPPSSIQIAMEAVNKVANYWYRTFNRELCDCGRSVTRVCACGQEVCSVHWYDADGNHTLSEKDGMCAECVAAVELQTWGESRCGIAGRQ